MEKTQLSESNIKEIPSVIDEELNWKQNGKSANQESDFERQQYSKLCAVIENSVTVTPSGTGSSNGANG